jgi:1-acyl-sn-glycerol-3-phosphate acyltransferase
VAAGGVLGIFPEGTRRSGEHIARKDIKRGVGILALSHGLSIIPVCIAGTEKGNRGPIAVSFEQAIPVEQQFATEDVLSSRKIALGSRAVINQLYDGMQLAYADAINLRAE